MKAQRFSVFYLYTFLVAQFGAMSDGKYEHSTLHVYGEIQHIKYLQLFSKKVDLIFSLRKKKHVYLHTR